MGDFIRTSLTRAQIETRGEEPGAAGPTTIVIVPAEAGRKSLPVVDKIRISADGAVSGMKIEFFSRDPVTLATTAIGVTLFSEDVALDNENMRAVDRGHEIIMDVTQTVTGPYGWRMVSHYE